MLQVVLVDDERCVLEELSHQLDGKVKIVGKFTNPIEALETIKSLAPDAVFLDIEMPELSGLETAAEVLVQLPEIAIVFVTAYSHHAVKAFELNAIDYLLKPVRPVRLEKTVERLIQQLAEGRLAAGNRLKNVLQSTVNHSRRDTILLWKGKHLEIKPVDSIAGCFVPKGERSVSVMVEENIYRTSENLNEFVTKIKAGLLVRCHRSYYINPRLLIRLEKAQGNTMKAFLAGYPDPIPVSRAYRQTLIKILTGIDAACNVSTRKNEL